MLWKRGRRSDNVVGADSGGGPRMPGGRGGMGIGGLLIVVVVALFLGKNPAELLSLLGGGAGPTTQGDAPVDAAPQALPETEETDFVRAILGRTEDGWAKAFEGGRTRLAHLGVPIVTLARVESMEGDEIVVVDPDEA